MNEKQYEARVQELEAEGLTRSDAQGVADVEEMKTRDYCGVCGGKFNESVSYPTLKNRQIIGGREICGECQQDAEDEI